MERRVHKDYIQLEIVVEKEGQKGILLGKVCCFLLWNWKLSRAALLFDITSD
jgi:GTPase Era involved in 16S rRNA processing